MENPRENLSRPLGHILSNFVLVFLGLYRYPSIACMYCVIRELRIIHWLHSGLTAFNRVFNQTYTILQLHWELCSSDWPANYLDP
jgi:hypothetical protein